MQKKNNYFIKFYRQYKHKFIVPAVMIIVSLSMVFAYAWYVSETNLEGTKFSTGSISYVAYGYNSDGELVSYIVPDENEYPSGEYIDKLGKPLFTNYNWHANSTDSVYIVVENVGSLNMEYKISFSLTGEREYAGGFWYCLTEITASIGSEESDGAKIVAYNSFNAGSTEDAQTAYSLNAVDRNAMRGSIIGYGKRYYRLDYGMSKTAITTEYTDKVIQLTTKIYATQIGAMDNEDGLGYTYTCANMDDVKSARDKALPGDNIKLSASFEFVGDLVFNKPVNIITNNYNLTVTGNLIYNYVSTIPLKLDVTGGGSITTRRTGEDGAGGNFTITTPNSNVLIVGANKINGDIVVEGNFSIHTTRSYGESGAVLTSCRINDLNTSALKAVLISGDSRIMVQHGTVIGTINAQNKVNYVEIINDGTISLINLTNMYMVASPQSPQIYIMNSGMINSTIILPSWSVPFKKQGTLYSGNTTIIQTITGNDMTVQGANIAGGFTNEDIEREDLSALVRQIKSGDDTKLIVYYQNTEDFDYTIRIETTETSIESMLKGYFRKQGLTDENEILYAIGKIVELQIVTVENKFIINTDFAFLKSSALPGLTTLDMSRGNIRDTTKGDNILCNLALQNKTTLRYVALPPTLVEIGESAFQNINPKALVKIPASVVQFGVGCFYGVEHLWFDAITPPPNFHIASHTSTFFAMFVNEAAIPAYINAYSRAQQTFPHAQVDDSGNNYVRSLGDGTYEIVYFTNDLHAQVSTYIIGNNISLNGLKIAISRVGSYAYTAKFVIPNVKLAFESTVRIINASAFYNCKTIIEISTNNVTYIGKTAFMSCSSLVIADMPRVTVLDGEAEHNIVGKSGSFFNCLNLVRVNLPLIKEIKGSAFGVQPVDSGSLCELYIGTLGEVSITAGGNYDFLSRQKSRQVKIFVPESRIEYFETLMTDTYDMRLFAVENVYKAGTLTKDGWQGYNIGEYLFRDNGDGTTTIVACNIFEIPYSIYSPPTTNSGFDTYVDLFTNQTINTTNKTTTAIGNYAYIMPIFVNSELLITGSIKSIGNGAFCNSTGIKRLETGPVTFIGRAAFRNSGITYANCKNVEIMYGENNGHGAFYSCTSLVSVYMPSIKEIGGSAFGVCNSLRELYIFTEDAIFLHGNTFLNLTTSKFRMFVPRDSYSYYFGSSTLSESIRNCLQGVDSFDRLKKVGTKIINDINIGEYLIYENQLGGYTCVGYNIDEISGIYNVPTTIGSGNIYDIYGVLNGNFQGGAITEIGDNMYAKTDFINCTLIIGAGIEKIGDRAFYNKPGIVTLNLSSADSLTHIGNSAFAYSSITTLDTNNVEYIGPSAFYACYNLVEANLRNVITLDGGDSASVGYAGSFFNCRGLIVVYAYKLQNMLGSAFSCSSGTGNQMNLREVHLGEYNNFTASTGSYKAFSNQPVSKFRIFIPASSFDDYYGTNLSGYFANVVIVDELIKMGTQYIGDYNIGEYLIKIEDGAAAIMSCNIATITGYYKMPATTEGYALFDMDGNQLENQNVHITSIYTKSSPTIAPFALNDYVNCTMVIGDYITVVPYRAFASKTGLISVEFNNVTTIQNLAFIACPNLVNIDFGIVESVGLQAFQQCTALVAVDLKNVQTFTGSYMFQKCTNLKSVVAPKLKYANSFAFVGCTSLETVYFEDIATGSAIFNECTALKTVVINRIFTSVNGLLNSATNLIDPAAPCTVYVPEFSKISSNITEYFGKPVAIYSAMIVVGNDTYAINQVEGNSYEIVYYMGTTENVVIPESFTLTTIEGTTTAYFVSIKADAFADAANSMRSITLPSTFTIIRDDSFIECAALENIYVHDDNLYYSSIDGVLYSKDGKVLIRYPRARSGSSYVVPNSTEYIAASAFIKANLLRTITFNPEIYIIDSTAFQGCTALMNVVFTSTTPPMLPGNNTFNEKLTGFNITVPAGSLTAYRSAYNFQIYAPYITETQ